MRQFEYFTEVKNMLGPKDQFEYLNEMGADGWQLCQIVGITYIFMREIRGNPVSQSTPQTTGVVSPYH